MAGAGYKLFATGDVLTAAQVNTYLMQQTTMVFASSAARTTALSGVLAEGMVTYLQDTNSLEYYDGTSWISAVGDITGVTAGTGLTGGGTSGTVTLNVDNTIIQGYTSTATAGGTTTLTASSTTRQLFTGTLNQTVVLPVTSTLSLGSSFKIRNLSTGTLTVNSSGGNLVVSIPSGAGFVCTCILTSGTTAASWDADFEGASGITGTGNAVLASSPTLTAPRITSASNIADANGNELILFPTAVASAVNEITVSNAATAGTPSITASGGDTNISLNLVPKGTGTVQIGGVAAVTTTGTQTLTNKTLTSPVINLATNTPTFTTNAYTLVAADAYKFLLGSNGATAGTVNIPTNASVAFAIGTQITIIQTGAGQLTITATTPATTTILSTGATAASPKLRAIYSSATLIKTGTDAWYVVGDIA